MDSFFHDSMLKHFKIILRVSEVVHFIPKVLSVFWISFSFSSSDFETLKPTTVELSSIWLLAALKRYCALFINVLLVNERYRWSGTNVKIFFWPLEWLRKNLSKFFLRYDSAITKKIMCLIIMQNYNLNLSYNGYLLNTDDLRFSWIGFNYAQTVHY